MYDKHYDTSYNKWKQIHIIHYVTLLSKQIIHTAYIKTHPNNLTWWVEQTSRKQVYANVCE